MITLKLQKQPTRETCAQTCLAMALGVPVEAVIDQFGSSPMSIANFTHALDECRFEWNQFVRGSLIVTGWYFLTVPSLNIRGSNHMILVHVDADRGCSGMTVLDPSTMEVYAPDGSDLKTWTQPILFIPGGNIHLDEKYL